MIWTKSMGMGFWSTWGTPTIRWLPSGKHTKNDGKSLFSIGKSTISLAIFNSYVSLPEGNTKNVNPKPSVVPSLWLYHRSRGIHHQIQLRIFFRQKMPFSSLRKSPKFVVPTLTTAPFGVDRLLKEQPWELVGFDARLEAPWNDRD